MNPIALAVAAALAALLFLSVRRTAIGVFGLVLLVPLYYVIRGTGGQTAFVFVWPYLFVGAYLHVLAVKAMSRHEAPPAAWYGLYAAYAVLACVLLMSASFLWASFSAPLPAVIAQFNSPRVILITAAAGFLVVWPLIWTRPRTWRASLTAADWMVIAFAGYGVFQIALSVARTGHLFYTLESFRYYFAMSLVYFAARFGLEERTDAVRLGAAVAACGLLVGIEFIAEHYLFNAGVSSLSLPWLRAFDEMFAGYGRPMPVEGFYAFAADTDSKFIPYSGIRGIGLLLHPHTAGLFAVLTAALLIPPLFDRARRHGGWLTLAVGLLFYASLMSIARSAVLLGYFLLVALPLASWWLLRARFVVARLVPYAAVMLFALAGASFWSPGGELPYFNVGWYQRPVYFAARAVMGDLIAWERTRATPASSPAPTRPPSVPPTTATPAPQPSSTPAPATTAPVTTAPPAPVTTAPLTPVTTAPPAAVTVPTHDTTAPDTALGVAAGVIGASPVSIMLFGAGFSPMTKYVVDYFPEAAGFRHVTSTSDVALLEFFQQFGGIGLGLLLAMFAVFTWEGLMLARTYRPDAIGQLGLAAAFVVALTLLSMLHLYPLFRIGMNTSFYALLGGLGYLRAQRLGRT